MSNDGPKPVPYVAPRVLVINFDPIFPSQAGKTLHQVCGWNDPRRLTEGYIADLAECSNGYARYQVIVIER